MEKNSSKEVVDGQESDSVSLESREVRSGSQVSLKLKHFFKVRSSGKQT